MAFSIASARMRPLCRVLLELGAHRVGTGLRDARLCHLNLGMREVENTAQLGEQRGLGDRGRCVRCCHYVVSPLDL